MHIDVLNQFGNAATLIGATGSNAVGDVIDLDPTDSGNIPNIGAGEPMWLVARIATAVDSAADGATVNLQLVSSAAEALTSPTVHAQSGVLAEAVLIEGYQALAIRIPSGTYLKYLGILAVVAGEAVTAGALDAYLTHDISDWEPVADGLASGA